jgi:hypothetical protein
MTRRLNRNNLTDRFNNSSASALKLECQAEPDANHLNHNGIYYNEPFFTV